MPDPSRVSDWIFDLDNTLYPRRCDLFGQMDVRMTAYVSRLTGLPSVQARILQKRLYRDYGTTLNGLMLEYDIDPQHYLTYVHDIDYSVVPPNPSLAAAIARLPGRRHIFTNGNLEHVERTLAAIGIDGSTFDSVFDIVAAKFEPKPMRGSYERFVAGSKVDATHAVMFEDLARNLAVAKDLGMTTVLVVDGEDRYRPAEAWEAEGNGEEHIDLICEDVADFLEGLWQGEHAVAVGA